MVQAADKATLSRWSMTILTPHRFARPSRRYTSRHTRQFPLCVSLLRPSSYDYITPLDILLFPLPLSALTRYPLCIYPYTLHLVFIFLCIRIV